jgi:diguanylate cyclase (GGDEF)-like protein
MGVNEEVETQDSQDTSQREDRISLRSPLAMLVVISGAIFLSEFIIMLVLPAHMSPFAEALWDAVSLITLLLPVLYFFLLRPMTRRIAEREHAEAALREAHNRLELRVQDRTAELERINNRLQMEVTERRHTEEALHQANERLQESIAALEQRTRESALFAQLSDLLQGCTTTEEAGRAIGRIAPQLFPGCSGVLFAFSPSRDDLEAIVKWGDGAVEMADRIFEPGSCWALRLGRANRAEGLCEGLPCRASSEPANSFCAPMIAQGETLGVLHLRSNPLTGTGIGKTASQEQLAVTIAERIALAVANLRLQETLRNQSIRDPLTGLFNRRFMEETLAREIRRAQRSQHPMGVILLDLDHFKRFNDSYGHAAGDTLLRELGGFIRGHIRGGDVGCRYGGEEFLLILPESDSKGTCARAEELRKGVSGLNMAHRGQPLGAITMSLGVAIFPEHALDMEDLLRSADRALYQAKQAGRDRVMVAGAGEVK